MHTAGYRAFSDEGIIRTNHAFTFEHDRSTDSIYQILC